MRQAQDIVQQDKYLKKAEELQQCIHDCVEGMKERGAKASYDDLMNTALMLKIGEILVRLEELESK